MEEDVSTYKQYGYRGMLLDMVYQGYFTYNFTNRVDDLTYILFDKFYLTPWVQRSPFTKPIYKKQECIDKMYENIKSICEKLRKRDYNIREEAKDLKEVFSDMESKFLNLLLNL